MKKTIILLIILAILMTMLTSCTSYAQKTPEDMAKLDLGFEYLGRLNDPIKNSSSFIYLEYYRDPATDVVYVYGTQMGFCPIMDADGTARTWSEIQGE